MRSDDGDLFYASAKHYEEDAFIEEVLKENTDVKEYQCFEMIYMRPASEAQKLLFDLPEDHYFQCNEEDPGARAFYKLEIPV